MRPFLPGLAYVLCSLRREGNHLFASVCVGWAEALCDFCALCESLRFEDGTYDGKQFVGIGTVHIKASVAAIHGNFMTIVFTNFGL